MTIGIVVVTHDSEEVVPPLPGGLRQASRAGLELLRALWADDRIGVVAPRLSDADGATVPSVRRNPSVARAAFVALVGEELAGLTPLGEIVSSRARYRRSHLRDWWALAAGRREVLA